MVEDVLDAKQLEWQSDKKIFVRRIAALNDVEPAFNINPPGIGNFPKQGPSVLPDIAEYAIPFPGYWVSIDVDSPEKDVVLHVAFGARTQYGYLIPIVVECTSFFPNA